MTTTYTKNEQIRHTVREHYTRVAQAPGASCCAAGCCVPSSAASSLRIGYSERDLAAVPEGADLGLGCGNPRAIASLRPGQTVVDLGSGAGFDCLLAAREVGAQGRVIGVDMTVEMVSKARANAGKAEAENVEFRLGEIEHLPVADGSTDVVLSNCVINLAPDKLQVLREAFRVLKPGGRLALADVVALSELPDSIRQQAAAISGCIAGAARVDEYRDMLAAVGFDEIRVSVHPESREFVRDWLPGSGAERYVASASVEAIKPKADGCCAPDCCSEDGGA